MLMQVPGAKRIGRSYWNGGVISFIVTAPSNAMIIWRVNGQPSGQALLVKDIVSFSVPVTKFRLHHVLGLRRWTKGTIVDLFLR